MATTERIAEPTPPETTSTAVETWKRTGVIPVDAQAEIAAYLARRRVE